jgi:Ca-activated chloride channel family protein
MTGTRVLALVAGVALGAASTSAQQGPVFRSSAQIVSVYTTVLGSDGRLVTDLTKDDFEIFDDARPQPITVFSNTTQPISIVVMLDTSGSMMGNVKLLKEASAQLFTQLLPADKARVGNFGDRITVSEHFTNDQNELIRWLWTELEPGGETPLWGAVNVGMTALEHVDGRRVVLVFTDGYDTAAREFVTERDVIARAQAEEFMVYGVGLWSRGGGYGPVMRTMPPDPGLRTLAEESGGGYFELTNANDLTATFTRVADELHHQYLLGFPPSRADGKLHRLDVRVRRPSMVVRARKSYVAPGPDSRQ